MWELKGGSWSKGFYFCRQSDDDDDDDDDVDNDDDDDDDDDDGGCFNLQSCSFAKFWCYH